MTVRQELARETRQRSRRNQREEENNPPDIILSRGWGRNVLLKVGKMVLARRIVRPSLHARSRQRGKLKPDFWLSWSRKSTSLGLLLEYPAVWSVFTVLWPKVTRRHPDTCVLQAFAAAMYINPSLDLPTYFLTTCLPSRRRRRACKVRTTTRHATT